MPCSLDIDQHKLTAFCEKNHIRKLSIFGSALRDDFTDESDVDVLVEFDPDHVPGYFGLGDMEEELSALIGRKVDLRTPGDLSTYFREEVMRNADTRYVA